MQLQRVTWLLAAGMAVAAACSGGGDDLSTARQGQEGPDGGPGADSSAEAGTPPGLSFDGAFVSLWQRESVMSIERDATNTFPIIYPPPEPIEESVWFWDFWPVRNPDNEIADIGGYTVIVGLVADRQEVTPGGRHGAARWGYFYRRPGEEWTYGGIVFPEGQPLGDRQWAGSANYDPATGRIRFFYTALGELQVDRSPGNGVGAEDGYEDARLRGESVVPQTIVETSAAVQTDGGVTFTDFDPHVAILEADGGLYATGRQALAEDALYVFRDPFYFADPTEGREYLLFTASAGAWNLGSHNGVAGLATREPDGGWRLLPPLIAALDVNSQIERPHMVYQDGRFYPFFTSHSFSFAEGLSGPEGLYGLVADNFRGKYVPLNGSGLVLGNPEDAKYQTYSYLALPGGLVTSFVNWVNLGDVTLAGISEQTEQWRRERFIGTPAPLLRIAIEGAETALVGEVDGHALSAGPGGQ